MHDREALAATWERRAHRPDSWMRQALGRSRRRLLGVSPSELDPAVRGFRIPATFATHARLGRIGETFLRGYHAALEDDEPAALGAALSRVDAELRGFAFEGAGMALGLLDQITPWRRHRLADFLDGPGRAHAYMVHIGAGWAWARLRRRVERPLRRLHPLLGWLAVDGYGFHEGYFHPSSAVAAQRVPSRLRGYARSVFDQGLGRSLWFVCGAEAPEVRRTVQRFAPARREDLWSGVGLACAYAGGVGRGDVRELRRAAGAHGPMLAQGAAFAAKARERAGNPAPHTELACRILCGVGASEAARCTDDALAGLAPDPGRPAFAVWRERIQSHFARRGHGPS